MRRHRRSPWYQSRAESAKGGDDAAEHATEELFVGRGAARVRQAVLERSLQTRVVHRDPSGRGFCQRFSITEASFFDGNVDAWQLFERARKMAPCIVFIDEAARAPHGSLLGCPWTFECKQ